MIPSNQFWLNNKSNFTPEALAYFNQVVANGGAPLSNAWKQQLNLYFIALKSTGYINEIDRIHSLYNENEIAAKTSLINPSQPMLTYGGTPSFVPFYGIQTNGTSSYIKTGFTPSSGVKFTQNSAMAGFGVINNVNDTGIEFGCSDGVNIVEIASCYTGVFYADLNDAGPNNTQANAALIDADYILVRTASNSLSAYKNNAANTNATVSTARPSKECYLGAWNDNGVPNYYKAATYTWFAFGSKNINISTFRQQLSSLT